MVRSKAEKIIADYLFENEIDYIYEKTIELGRAKHKIKYDFYLPKYDIYIEYWGLGDLNNQIGENYRIRKEEKIQLYNKYKLKLISLDQKDLPKLNQILSTKIEEFSGIKYKMKLFMSKKIKQLLFDLSRNEEDKRKLFCTECSAEIIRLNEYCTSCGYFNKEEI